MRASNFISLTGNLGGPVEIKEPTPGIGVARLSIAETISRPNPKSGVFEQVHVNWIPVTAFGSLAKRSSKSLKKGDRVTVLGALKTTTFEKEGESRRGFEVIAYSIEKAQLLAKAEGHEPSMSETLPSFEDFGSEEPAGGSND